jgi:citrate lyase subunit beta / citryl-CoA lyase
MSGRGALRSLLFVPGDSERKQTKALASGADALILDLEDSVAPAQLPAARTQVRQFLATNAGAAAQRWVRVNSPSSGILREDVAAVIDGRPDGIVLPKVSSVSEVAQASKQLAELEKKAGIAIGSTRLIVIATETPVALLKLGEYVAGTPGLERLAALTWGMEDLSAALGAAAKTETDGSLTPVFELARSLCLVAAAAASVPAIDGVHADFRDSAGLAREAARARRDGFTAKLAIHPDQVPFINAAFSPSTAEVERARRIVAAFAASPNVGVTSLDGQMLDRPHLLLAQRILALASRIESDPTGTDQP